MYNCTNKRKTRKQKDCRLSRACGYGYKIVCQYDDTYSKPYKGYRGPDAVYKLMENLLKEQKEIKNIIKQNFNKKMIISIKEQNDFENTK